MSANFTSRTSLVNSRKRSAEMALDDDHKRGRRDAIQCELESLQAELEHERSLRSLDAKRFVQSQQRLEKQLEFALQETKEAKALMEEMQQEQETHVEQLKRARARAQEQLRQVQEELEEERAMAAGDALDEDPRIRPLQHELQACAEENQALKGTIAELQGDWKRYMQRDASSSPQEDVPIGALSEARPDVLKELNRVRILLAESERKNRQHKRALEEAALGSKQLIHEKERLRSANKRIEQLEAELREQTKTEETAVAELKRLNDEHKVVLEKFGKLREAVYEERAKAEKASVRADEAEALAGKGSFDPEKTRVLHLSNNPLTQALKEEIKVLRRQVEALSDSGKKKKASGIDVDPNKLHQRLKQSFKEQIGRFREGVYLMTGYKVRQDFGSVGSLASSDLMTPSLHLVTGRYDSWTRQ
jgi:mitotic spindle assembly checkpoint protein MAD1